MYFGLTIMLSHLLSFDHHLFILINSHHCPIADWFFICITQLGNGWLTVPVLFGIIFVKTPRQKLLQVFIWAAIAMSINGICDPIVKTAVARHRPLAYFCAPSQSCSDTNRAQQISLAKNDRCYAVHTFGPTYYFHSFPSGHSNTSFAAATVLVILYGGFFWLSYGVAALVAFSRIYLGAHFPLDTLGGALLGVFVISSVFLIKRSFLGADT